MKMKTQKKTPAAVTLIGTKNQKSIKRLMSLLSCAVMFALLFTMSMPVFAEDTTTATQDDPITIIHNFSDLIFGIIAAVGGLMMVWGVVQFAMAVQQHDPSARMQAILVFIGGVLIATARFIVAFIAPGIF